MARRPQTLVAEPDETAEQDEKSQRKRNPRYGMAYASFRDLMSAQDGAPHCKTYVLPVNVDGLKELCVRATSYAQAMDAACLFVFGKPRKLTDKQQLEMMRKELASPSSTGLDTTKALMIP